MDGPLTDDGVIGRVGQGLWQGTEIRLNEAWWLWNRAPSQGTLDVYAVVMLVYGGNQGAAGYHAQGLSASSAGQIQGGGAARGVLRKPCIEKCKAALVQIIRALARDIDPLARARETPACSVIKPWLIVYVEVFGDHERLLFLSGIFL